MLPSLSLAMSNSHPQYQDVPGTPLPGYKRKETPAPVYRRGNPTPPLPGSSAHANPASAQTGPGVPVGALVSSVTHHFDQKLQQSRPHRVANGNRFGEGGKDAESEKKRKRDRLKAFGRMLRDLFKRGKKDKKDEDDQQRSEISISMPLGLGHKGT